MQDMAQTKTKIKICFVITKGVWGGAGKYVYTLATELSKEIYEPVVICGVGDALPEKLRLAGIRVEQIDMMSRDISISDDIKSFFTLYAILKKEKPNVLHMNSPKVSGLGAVAGRLLGIPHIIYTAHGWTFNEHRSLFEKVLIRFLSWLTIMFCHKTIVIAHREWEQARAMPCATEHKIILIRNGIGPIEYKEKKAARNIIKDVTKKVVTENTLWLGTISELHKNKGLLYLIFALTQITIPFVFCIVGDGEEKENLKKLIEKNNLQDKVFLLGFIDNANTLLKAFDIFTLTSLKEGLPYVILEAGQAGLPVIASNIGGIPDIIENNVSGMLVAKEKPSEINRAIQYLIDNPDKQKTYGENLKQKIENDFSMEKMIKETIKLYE